jgi:Asp-tRNA(Asn)/Glu-tRNA(Gln) amidotransferase A subunit family amidase
MNERHRSALLKPEARMREYGEHDGLGLAALVTSRKASPIELLDAAIDRIERHNGALNARRLQGFRRGPRGRLVPRSAGRAVQGRAISDQGSGRQG